MQEKNIRWGEIASGILIVGSAVGLVISLREELRRTIPFFPALVFLLITGGIHAAGIYTLQRWKLRNTSRGALVIGLLLIPLNFLAACVLTGQGEDRREITDPVYWFAIITGLGAFTAMTWYSSKYLLRRGQLPLVAAILICSTSQLFNNRITLPTVSWQMMLLSVPMVVGYLIGVVLAVPRQWNRERWTVRSINRLLLFLGLSAFSFAAAVALIFSRTGNYIDWLVAMLPAFCCVFAMVAWIGAVVQQAAGQSPNLRITGTTLLILGTVLTVASVLSSIVYPAALLATSIVSGGLLCALAVNRRMAAMMSAVWACLGIAALTALNLALGTFHFNRATNLIELQAATVSAFGGLCLVVVGVCVLAGAWLLTRFQLVDATDRKHQTVNLASSGVMFLLGAALAVAASFVNRDNPFDVTTATILLFVLAALAFVVSFRVPHEAMPFAATVVLVGALLHALFWNRPVGEFVVGISRSVDTRWTLLAVLTAGACSVAALVLRILRRQVSTLPMPSFASCGHLAIGGSIISAMVLVPQASGFATASLSMTVIAAVTLASATRRIESALIFFATTALVTIGAVGEAALHFGWCESLRQARHVWIQLIAMAAWYLIWAADAWALRGRRWCYWLMRYAGRVEEVVLYMLCAAVTLLIVVGLSQDVGAELSRKVAARPDTFVQLLGNAPLVIAALATVSLAVFVSLLLRPASQRLAALIVLWFLAWSFSSVSLEPVRGVGSALRWLLPLGGVGLAALLGERTRITKLAHALRRQLRLRTAESWSDVEWQRLINLSLTIVVTGVLLISTLTVGQALLNGGDALGGPMRPSLLGDLRKDVSFGVPIAIIVATFLFYAITERRGWLAIAGSGVFQYVVLVSLVLLWASPHPKLATAWFLNILQAVSLGMTIYGFVWYAYLRRIGSTNLSADFPFSQLDLHATLNAVLVVSLSALILHRVFWFPTSSAGWINEAGGPLGYLALVLIVALSITIWPGVLTTGRIPFVGVVGLATAALVATTIDRYSAPTSWWPFRAVLMGTVGVVMAQCVFAVLRRRRSAHVDSFFTELPMLLFGGFALMFAMRGASYDLGGFWLHIFMMLMLVWTATAYGIAQTNWQASWIAAALALVAGHLIFVIDPHGWFSRGIVHVWMLSLHLVSFIWLGFYVVQRRVRHVLMPRNFVRLPNVVALLSGIWILLAGIGEWLVAAVFGRGFFVDERVLLSPLGGVVIASSFGLLLLNTWNDRARFKIVSRYLWMTGLAIAIVVVNMSTRQQRAVVVALVLGWLTAAWALWWYNRHVIKFLGRKIGIPRPAATHRVMSRQLPTIHVLIAAVVLLIVWPAIASVEERWLRYLAALAVVPLAFGFGAFADERRVWIRWASLATVTLSCVLLSWADLSPMQMSTDDLSLPIRTFFVLAAAMFVYGAVLPRLMNATSTWMPTIRQATGVTCLLSIVCFAAVLVIETRLFDTETGCGLPVPTAVAAAVMVLAMVAGLICIAVLPRHDPLALDDLQRTGYVYVAEAVAAGMIGHLYLSMPWLFQFGIKQFWPYVAMLLSFGGVALANMLDKRKLQVLAQPFFHTAAILPVIVVAGFRAIEHRADGALVMLLAGGIYMMISMTRASLTSGVAAVIFANFALWLFYNRFPALEFLTHPQMWLIPPAVSALVAVQLHRDQLTKSQLATVRYLCVAVIYISSTSEIFISGIGDQLWPPMVLAVLAVAGMLVGIMMQVRAYLFLGALFLLMAMLSMVAHAQQRLNNVWPWWAFGIVMGISLLVFFGFFEKRKNEMLKIARQMSEWDL